MCWRTLHNALQKMQCSRRKSSMMLDLLGKITQQLLLINATLVFDLKKKKSTSLSMFAFKILLFITGKFHLLFFRFWSLKL